MSQIGGTEPFLVVENVIKCKNVQNDKENVQKAVRYVTCKAKQLLVHPVEAFVEEAGELVPKRHTVAVIEATLVVESINEASRTFISCCIIVY